MGIEFVLVFIGGALGAVCRYGISVQMKRMISTEFPLATFLINLTGSFFLGLLMAASSDEPFRLLLGTGFLGGFTTFSTFQVENVTLYLRKKYLTLLGYVLLSVGMCILFAYIGLLLGIQLR